MPEGVSVRAPRQSWGILLALLPVAGLALLLVPGNELGAGLIMLTWPLPLVYLAVVRRWHAAALTAAAMAAVCLAGLGWVIHTWKHTGCMYGLVLLAAVPFLGGSAVLASLLGLLFARLNARAPSPFGAPLTWLANVVVLAAALVVVVPWLVALLPNWTQ